jgi:DNA-binding MarR family transcriptional regulator
MDTNEEQGTPEGANALVLAGSLRVLLGRLKRRLRKEGVSGDLTWSQKSILAYLYNEKCATVTTLARVEGVRPQSMGATVAMLEAAGYIVGVPNPADGRQTVLSLTASCEELIRAGRAAREDWLFRTIRAKLTEEEQQQLAIGVGLLERLVDSSEKE